MVNAVVLNFSNDDADLASRFESIESRLGLKKRALVVHDSFWNFRAVGLEVMLVPCSLLLVYESLRAGPLTLPYAFAQAGSPVDLPQVVQCTDLFGIHRRPV